MNPKTLVHQAVDKTGTVLLSPPYGGLGQFINHGPRNERKVAITFDDGPSKPCTEALLDAMGELDVKGTFFWVGVNAGWHPDLIERAYKEGHAVGNHSMRHSRKAGIQLNEDSHIDEAAQQISRVIGVEPRLYRPPWGWLTPWEAHRLHRRGYSIIGWDVYTLDWQWPEPDGAKIAEQALRDTRPGSIILFHDASAGVENWDKKETIRAIRQLVPALRADGYEVVTVADLLHIPAYSSPVPATTQAM